MPRKRDDDEDDRDDEDRPRSKRNRKDEGEDDENDRPRSKGKRQDDEAIEEEGRPRAKRSRSDEEDDYDDEEEDRRRSVRKKGRLDRASLWSVAIYQKGILVCILVYLGVSVAGFFVPADLKWIVGIVALPVLISATVFVFLLSMKVYHPAVGVLLALLTLIPCVGLIVLLIINGQATSVLRRHDVHVGLLGASLSDLA